MNSRIDVRILTLKKYALPHIKTYVDNNVSDETYVSAHYFDYIEFNRVKLDDNGSKNFLEKAYEKIVDIRSETKENAGELRIQQNIILFDFLDDKKAETFDEFWNVKASHIFITMFKLYNCDNRAKLKYAKKKLATILSSFGVDAKDYVIYYTFDFSDLVLVIKNIYNSIFQDFLWTLNYSTLFEDSSKLVKDSVTLYGVSNETFQKIVNTNKSEGLLLKNDDCERLNNIVINASISLGVQEPSLFKTIYNFLEIHKLKDVCSISAQFGRHDITMSLKNISVFQLVQLYGEIRRVSAECNNVDQSFLSMKVISSVAKSSLMDEIIQNQTMIKSSELNDSLWMKNLKNIIWDCLEEYMKKADDSQCMYAVEIYRSIYELSRHSFSEEFLISIYHAFYVFLKINIENFETFSEQHIDFQTDFFSCINILSHCTMHGEKCFIQSAQFNSLLIDIPPKILAYYTAISFKIVKILRDNKKQLFSFVFVPSFNSNIKLRSITPGEDMDSRLLSVNINEKMMHNPYKVVCIMFHEIAHYVGDETRCRKERLDCIIATLLRILLSKCGVREIFFDSTKKLQQNIKDEIVELKNKYNLSDFYMSVIEQYIIETGFLYDLFVRNNVLFDDFDESKDLTDYMDTDDFLFDYLNSLIKDNQTQKYGYKVLSDIETHKIKSSDDKPLFYEDYYQQCVDILHAYEEAYSDLILCTFTGINQNQYLELINEETGLNLDVTKINDQYLFDKMIIDKDKKSELFIRIRAILTVCFNFTTVNQIKDLDSETKTYNIINEYLVEYLKSCYGVVQRKLLSNDENVEFSKMIKNLYKLSTEDALFSLYEDIFKYKKIMLDDIQE